MDERLIIAFVPCLDVTDRVAALAEGEVFVVGVAACDGVTAELRMKCTRQRCQAAPSTLAMAAISGTDVR